MYLELIAAGAHESARSLLRGAGLAEIPAWSGLNEEDRRLRTEAARRAVAEHAGPTDFRSIVKIGDESWWALYARRFVESAREISGAS